MATFASKSMPYLIKLASILWWALLTQSATFQFPDARKPAAHVPEQGLIPGPCGLPAQKAKSLAA
ncbi:hypothetical protein DSO57_1020237 [Entomophthora muscae]|uniref:Uncharacterized protein n=1 Tax=Entomophthora muscae TaxID=34485 RepID=A0ACC2TEG0_9FUNG|nr:hypothetical protein DSO57_1020237 [Entomophthora muscae]